MRFRSYTNKRGTIIKCFMNGTLLLLMLAGCGTVSELETGTETGSSDVNAAAEQQIVEKEDADIEQLKGRCQEIALTCQGLFFDAETEEADNFSNSTLLTQAAVDSIEDRPHLHVSTSSASMSVAIDNGDILACSGKISPAQKKMAREWMAKNKDLVIEKWNTFSNGLKIPVS